MANKEIDDLTAASALAGSEIVHIVQAGNSRKTTVNELARRTAETGALELPSGTTAQRPTATAGRFRWNSTLGMLEVANGTGFDLLPSAALGHGYATNNTRTTLTTIIPLDDTIPQSTEGTQILSLSYTPKSTSSVLRIDVDLPGVGAVGQAWAIAALFNGGSSAIAAQPNLVGGPGWVVPMGFKHFLVPGSTSPITFTVRLGPGSGTIYLNGVATRYMGGVLSASLSVTEYAT